MAFESRKIIYNKIQEKRKRPLLVYVTSIRPGINVMMAQDVIPEIIRHIDAIKDTENGIDIFIISTGGDPIVSLRIDNLLRDRFKNISAMIPYNAYSAATLLALGADEIIMHPYANLGPVDPQLTVNRPNQPPMNFAYEDIKKYVEFVKDIGISDQELMEKSFELLTKEVGTVPIGVAKRSSQLALSLSEKLLSSHMQDKAKAKSISEMLNTAFYHHGYPLSRNEAKEIGLQIAENDPEVEKWMWEICEDFSNEMQFNEFFDIQKIVSTAINNNFNPTDIGKFKSVRNSVKIASVESMQGESYIEQVTDINFIVAPDLNVTQNITQYTESWKNNMIGG
ncbi:uncharacterized protein BN681_00562 [Clostridium sp. CAG:492]|jgi:hypothetical protein|nr:uncharacterized protein BN681_00562 [Clostridium sp. CAG:492]